MNEKISLAGDLGSGKSTVSKILIKELSAEYYSTGAIVRSIAERRGMTVVELNVYMETHPEIDNEIDDGLVALGEIDKPLIIDSRMAWHFTKGTFKVYLSTDVETSAYRIMNANRQGEHASSLEDTIKETKARRESEKKRYMQQYGVDIKDLTNYDLIVDTTIATPEEVAACIITAYRTWLENKDYKCAYISPLRLGFPDDEADSSLIEDYSLSIELGRELPAVSVFEVDGDFYVDENVEAAIALSFNSEAFIPCSLKKGSLNGKKYVKMTNSL